MVAGHKIAPTESDAVVGDAEHVAPRLVLEVDGDVRRARMLADVRERFGRDAVEGRPDERARLAA
jgi:hypothetical protein